MAHEPQRPAFWPQQSPGVLLPSSWGLLSDISMLAQAVRKFTSFNPEENAPGGSPQCLVGHSWWVNGLWQTIHSASGFLCISALVGKLGGTRLSFSWTLPCILVPRPCLRLCFRETYTKTPLILMIPLHCHTLFIPVCTTLTSELFMNLFVNICLLIFFASFKMTRVPLFPDLWPLASWTS